MTPFLARLTAGLLACGASTLVQAAGPASTMTVAPSAAVACLAPADADRGSPVYPAEQYELGRGARVAADLVFTGPDRPPAVRFMPDDDADEFHGAIEAWASRLRVPCMGAGDPPVALRQEYHFVPNKERKVMHTAFSDRGDGQRREAMGCIRAPKGPEGAVFYPDRARDKGLQGRLVVRLRFSAPDRAPEETVLDDGGSPSFDGAARGYFEQLRMPCVGSTPVDVLYRFYFQLDGEPPLIAPEVDLDLSTFLRMTTLPPPGSVFHDTNAMRCPLDVHFVVGQPWESNRVEELDDDVPARHAFLAFLAERSLRTGSGDPRRLYERRLLVHVPCIRLDL